MRENITKSIEKMNISQNTKYKMMEHMKIQMMNKSKEQESYLEKFNCEKCRDLTFIIEDNVAIPCGCREVKIAKEILAQSGISEEFRKKTFRNYNYSYDTQTIEGFTKAINYAKDFKLKLPSRNNSIL